VRFGKCVNPLVIPSVQDVGMCVDGHVSDMRALWDARNSLMIPSVLYVGHSVVECGTIL